jgi:hypothetical protein
VPSNLNVLGCRNQQALEEVWSEVKRLKALRHQADLTPERKIEKTKKYLVRFRVVCLLGCLQDRGDQEVPGAFSPGC